MSIKITPKDYHAIATNRGFKWLGVEVQDTSIKTGWECPKGHTWQATYDSIRRGRKCPNCATGRIKPADYHTLAKKRGFKWLGIFPKSTNIKTGWECEKGHKWQSKYSNLRNGSGCPICANTSRGEANKANRAAKAKASPPKPAAKKRRPNPKQGQSKAIKTFARLLASRPAALQRLETERERLVKIGITSHNDQAAVFLYSRSKEQVEFKGEEETEWASQNHLALPCG